jgi:hypothetical protein
LRRAIPALHGDRVQQSFLLGEVSIGRVPETRAGTHLTQGDGLRAAGVEQFGG